LTLYLQSGGRANSSKGDGVLASRPEPGEQPPDVFVYDPEVPVTGPGGHANAPGPVNQAGPELGNNLLVYTSAALTEPLAVFGTAEVSLFCATSASDADLVAKLVCVRPAGDAFFVTLGILRRSDVTPDVWSEWVFQLEATSVVFEAGDRVRLEIASSAYPLYDRNPGTGAAPDKACPWNWRRSTQTLFHDAVRPSALRLPVGER
jgi:putative CocE/NonD family hydrolase